MSQESKVYQPSKVGLWTKFVGTVQRDYKMTAYKFLTGKNKGKSRKYGEGILPIPQIPPPLFISPPSAEMQARTGALLNRPPNEFVRLSSRGIVEPESL